jgi:putative ABC transport system ATP-binding protein
VSTLLEVERLSKTYTRGIEMVEALKQVSFKLEEGGFIAIMGTSGSGKITLLNILGALDAPTGGALTLKGKWQWNIFTEPAATLYRQQHIGFIFQSFHLLDDLTVLENIALPLMLKGIDEKTINQEVEIRLNRVRLRKWNDHRPQELSGGQQQRVAIARALISRPPIILADEPTGNIDVKTSAEIMQLLQELNRDQQTSILLVTHDATVAAHAKRVLYFHDGQIVADQPSTSDVAPILETYEKFVGTV